MNISLSPHPLEKNRDVVSLCLNIDDISELKHKLQYQKILQKPDSDKQLLGSTGRLSHEVSSQM